MSRAWKVVAISLGVLLTLIVVVVLTVTFLDWNRFRGTAENFLSKAAGRAISIGRLDVDLGRTSRITLRELKIANADWARERYLAQIEEARISIDSFSLLGTVRLPEIVLERPVIAAERKADGRASWDVGQVAEVAGEAVTPDEREEFPFIGKLVINDGQLRYRDEERALDLQGTIDTATGETVDELELSMKGSLEDLPARFDFRGGSLLQLRKSSEPYPFHVKLTAGETEVEARGTAKDPVKMEGVDIQLRVVGPSMAEVFPIYGIPLPPTASYSVDGRLRRDGRKWQFSEFRGRVGDSDLRGRMILDYTPERPHLEAVVESDELVFRDLAGLFGLDPHMFEAGSDKPAEEGGGVLPDTPIQVERLRAMDMDVRLKSAKVTAPDLPITALDMRFVLRDGQLRVDPLIFFVAEGKIEGSFGMDARQDVPAGTVDLALRQLDLRPFFRNSEFVQEMGGRFVGTVDLKGTGTSFAEMLGTADGRAVIGMREGSISALLVEAAGLDLVEALALLAGDDVAVRIRCGLVDMAVEDGVARVRNGVMDTADSLLLLQSVVDLKKEAFDLLIEAREKDFSLIDASAPVRIRGPFTQPSIAIGGVDPLPFFEMGEQEDIDCDRLLAQLEGGSAQ